MIVLLWLLINTKAGLGQNTPFPMDLNYRPNGSQIEITNSGRHFNRPLYGEANGLVIFGGDRPIVKVGCSSMFQGTLMIALRRGQTCPGGWAHLDPSATTVAGYRPGISSWRHTSPLLPDVELNMTAVPTDGGKGLAVRLTISGGGVQAGDELLWLYAGISGGYNPSTSDPSVTTNAPGSSVTSMGPRTDQLLDDRGNIKLMQLGFEPTHAAGNTAQVVSNHFNISQHSTKNELTVVGKISSTSEGAVRVVRFDPQAATWRNTSSLLPSGRPMPPPTPPLPSPSPPPSPVPNKDLPSKGLVVQLEASSLLAQNMTTGEAVAQWCVTQIPSSSSVAPVTFSQPIRAKQPTFFQPVVSRATPSEAWVRFNGSSSLSAGQPLPATKTVVAVAQPGPDAGGCCNALVCTYQQHATTPASKDNSTNGLAVKKDASAVTLVVDYDGENDHGSSDLNTRAVILSVRYNDTHAVGRVSGCDEAIISKSLGQAADTIVLGSRASDPVHLSGRFFQGLIAEVLIYNRSLSDSELTTAEEHLAHKYSRWLPTPTLTSKCSTAPTQGAEAVGGVIDLQKERSPIFFSFEADPALERQRETPEETFAAALARVQRGQKRVVVETPDVFINAGIPCAGSASDGLWRDQPPVFVHGAMAWDVPLIGWRSEYGGTIFGHPDRVAMEGVYWLSRQVVHDTPGHNRSVCKADASKHLAAQDPDSRFNGIGKIPNQHYDMQSQMFEQQIHMWRWTGNQSHAKLLRPGLELHAQWAHDSFDADGNGLYHSFINTWPTDAVWYNGGESVEETAYMLSTHEALRDMAALAGDTAVASRHAKTVQKIRDNFFKDGVGLWINTTGHPAAWREEIAHRRLRPDPWSYSIFLPIDAKLLTGLEAVQSLYYTEWGLQRLHMTCVQGDENGSTYNYSCGQRHWTSNWVPSVWSAREFWPGDNYALALAYFQTGLPDGGFDLLQGNLMHDMYNYMSPGALGSHNGGLDFNDIVNPAARTFIEGLFGIRPDLPNRAIEIAPQLAPDWDDASVTTPFLKIVARGFRQRSGSGMSSLAVELKEGMACAGCTLKMKLPVRATKLVNVTLQGAATNFSVEPGFGQSVLTVVAAVPQVVGTVVTAVLHYDNALGYAHAVNMRGVAGEHINLVVFPNVLDDGMASTVIETVADPQGAFSSHTCAMGTVHGILSDTSSQYNLVSVMIRLGDSTGGPLLQHRLFKLNITRPTSEVAAQAAKLQVPAAEARSSTFRFVNISKLLNADLKNIFHPVGGYTEPRPATCACRIATDGYSPWSFKNAAAGQGDLPPYPDFSNVSSDGLVVTANGGRFQLYNTHIATAEAGVGETSVRRNVGFVSQWCNWPTQITVPLPGTVDVGDVIWLLVAGSTNNMQTRLANAVLRFNYSDGHAETLELVPPLNYWSLTKIAGIDYDYSRDGFCLPPEPPPQVQLGEHNRAMVYTWRVTSGGLDSVTLEALSLEVVVGLLAVSISSNHATGTHLLPPSNVLS